MRNQIQLVCLGLMMFLGYVSASFACGGGEDSLRPLDRVAREAEVLVQKHEFARLEAMATQYKTQNSSTSDGQPKLMGFYTGTSKSSSNCQGVTEPDKEWETHKLLLGQWSKEFPDSIAAKLSMALFETSYAWHARGGGYASSVSEEGWKLFRQRIATSRAMLEQLENVASSDPQWHSAMLRIALAQGWERAQFDSLFEKAIHKFPYYLAYYFTKGSFYSAKWRGSQVEFKAFVEESVKSTEEEMGQTMYARLNWSAQDGTMFVSGKTNWPRMKLGFETMIKDYPDAWNKNNFAKFSCMAGDWETFLSLLEVVNKQFARSAWESKDDIRACEEAARFAIELKTKGKVLTGRKD